MNKYKKQAKVARKERQKKRRCTDKVRYETQEQAHQKGQGFYFCRDCGGFHRTGKFAELLATVKKAGNK